MEQIDTLALALRGNSTLAQLDIIHTTRVNACEMDSELVSYPPS